MIVLFCQASEAGIHRPHVAGIHGREDRGAFSIVLSGGYEDDVDNGDEFWYTGSGGRDLSGNKRTAAQSSDQKLTRMNRALALNCNAPINEQKGSESKDWKKGKPVRVIRSSKLAKHSKYAPSKGNRLVVIANCFRHAHFVLPVDEESAVRVLPAAASAEDPDDPLSVDANSQPGPFMEPQPGPSKAPSSAPLTFTRPCDEEMWQRLVPDCTYEYIAADDDITVWGTLDDINIIREQQDSSDEQGEEEPEDIPTTKAGDVYSRALKRQGASKELWSQYDGIYKVVKYYPEKGKAGFIVWRYVLRRDDPTFAPWTKEGKERINRLGLKLEYPENYLEAMASKEKTEGKKTPKAIESHKRKRLSSRNSEENIDVHEVKKVRPEPHSLEKDLTKLIDQDINTKLWGECKKHLIEGTQKFLENVMEQFLCICCQDLVFEPVTTECLHTFCKRCLHRSFAAQVYTCPCCRTELGKDYEMEINEPLSQILVKMFPGYTAGRN
uniref:RING-type E3 ubiquitin transferase n=1 Tax=Timema genevievae TaxID=629358 RepID=A0A7R9JYM3_TIMGE|nr:unnamed protein product [Timema genevievae]